MNKNIIVATLAAVMMTSAASVSAADGTIQFTGEVLATACTVASVGNAGVVNLGKVTKASFAAVGAKSAGTNFTLNLSGCPDTLNNANVKFDGTAATGDTTVLGVSQATGIGIELSDVNNNKVPLNTDSASYSLTDGTGALQFTARYIALVEPASIVAGVANASTNFSIVYN